MPETEHKPSTDISDITERKYLQTTIGDLRKLYGVDFARGCADAAKITDVIWKQPSFMRIIPYHEKKRFPYRTRGSND
jgi:hypothetical protein